MQIEKQGRNKTLLLLVFQFESEASTLVVGVYVKMLNNLLGVVMCYISLPQIKSLNVSLLASVQAALPVRIIYRILTWLLFVGACSLSLSD